MIPRLRRSELTKASSSCESDSGRDFGRMRFSISASLRRVVIDNRSIAGLNGFGGFGLTVS